jgi:hypothetical protein
MGSLFFVTFNLLLISHSMFVVLKFLHIILAWVKDTVTSSFMELTKVFTIPSLIVSFLGHTVL